MSCDSRDLRGNGRPLRGRAGGTNVKLPRKRAYNLVPRPRIVALNSGDTRGSVSPLFWPSLLGRLPGQLSRVQDWRFTVALIRCMVFLPASLARHYEALGHRAGVSRSLLVRYGLKGRPAGGRGVRAVGPGGFRQRRPVDPSGTSAGLPWRLPRPGRCPEPRPFRTGSGLSRPWSSSSTASCRRPRPFEQDALKRLVALSVETLLGAPPDPAVLDEAIVRVLSSRPDDPPEPVGGNRPPE